MGQRDFVAILAVVGVMAGALSGCFTTQLVRTDTLVSYEVIRAPIAPPAIPEDAVLAAPSTPPPGATWMGPYWQWTNGQYTWIVGRWIPTLVGYTFVAPRWSHTRDGWSMSGGGWTDPSGHLVATPPPAPGAQAIPPTPDAQIGVGRCDPTPDPQPALTATAAPPPPARRTRIDHTVTLGHLTYGGSHRDRSEPEAPEHTSVAPTPAAPTFVPSPHTGTVFIGRSYGYASSPSSSYGSAPSSTPASSASSAPTGSQSYSMGSMGGYGASAGSVSIGSGSTRP